MKEKRAKHSIDYLSAILDFGLAEFYFRWLAQSLRDQKAKGKRLIWSDNRWFRLFFKHIKIELKNTRYERNPELRVNPVDFSKSNFVCEKLRKRIGLYDLFCFDLKDGEFDL